MKNSITLLIALLLCTLTLAQSPNKLSYQAIVRSANNELLNNRTVGIQISILQGSVNGSVVYAERQTPTTNNNGLISLQIGAGNLVAGSFETIDWSNGPYFIKTETDVDGGNNYTITGTNQLLSVPFALYAETSGSSTPGPQGLPGMDGADGKSAFELWLEQGNTGNIDSFLMTITGPQGLPGMDGVDGMDGMPGMDGADGMDGMPGPQGPPGLDGMPGMDGANGMDGMPGPQGPPGLDGMPGPQGPPGSANINGTTGRIIKFGSSTFGENSIMTENNNTIQIDGYIKTGTASFNPAFQIKDTEITTGSNEGDVESAQHFLDANKILSCTVLVNGVPPNFTLQDGFEYNFFFNDTHFYVWLHPSNSFNILNATAKFVFLVQE